MSVRKETVKKLVDRLCTLPSSNVVMFDSDAQAKIAIRAEMGRSIERYCGSDEHATRVVENLMVGRFRPTPGEIRDASLATPANEPQPEYCSICEGQPWITVQKRAKDPSGVVYMADGAERCRCARGQWLRGKDQENKAKREAGLPV